MSPLVRLGILGVPLYAAVTALSFGFGPESVPAERPLLPVLALLGCATVLWWFALRQAQRSPTNGVREVVFFAILYRVILLPSWPIQEIDFYRYLWDGRVTLHGLNPYHYSPSDVDSAEFEEPETLPTELAALRRLAHSSDSGRIIFERVHYRDIPTAYGPASQAVFALVVRLTPPAAPVWVHLLILKIALLLFDLGTLAVLIGLLRRLQLPLALALAYGWCPLALKELANTAHLDSIAVFFTTLSLLLIVGEGRLRAMAALAALALGVLAKTYPLVLLPLMAVYLFRRRLRFSLLPPLAIFALVLLAGFLPFRGAPERGKVHHAGTGLGEFLLTRWEMNDLLFMVVNRNLSRPGLVEDRWFVVVPASWREALHDRFLESWAGTDFLPDGADPAYLLALLVTVGALAAIGAVQCWRVFRQPEAPVLLRACFLVLAWGWLLMSTQNPWYVLWSLPLLPFAGAHSWYLLPGLALLYYLRFWMAAQWPETEAWAAFDYGVVWLEYVPLFVCLIGERLRASRENEWNTT